MPFIPKSTGIPTVDKVFKEVFAILNRFQGGKVASSSGESVDWADIVNKPSTFAPASHALVGSTHTVSGLTNGHVMKALSATTYGFGATAWSEITDKPSVFAPSAHTHPWSGITDKPSTFAPSAHSHLWADITDKPSTFTPSSHGLVSSTHTVSGLTAGHVLKALSATSFGFAAIAWSEITDKPSTFAPAAHTHSAIDLPANVVYTDNAQTITGVKTFSSNTTFGGDIIGSNVNGLAITTNTVDGSDNKYVSLFGAGGNANRAAGLVAYGNEHSEGQGDLRLYAGSSGAIRLYGNTILSGNTAFGKNTFVGGYRVEVEGNALVNGTLTVNVIPAKTTEVGVYLTHDNNTIKTRTAAQVRDDIGAAAVSHSHAWGDITGKPSTFAPASHALVGSAHTVSGLTTGHVLKALSTTSFGFEALTPSEIGAPAIGTERSLSITTAGWVTIATCATGRAYGEFHVYDSSSGRHNFTKIIASTSYGVNNVSVIGGNCFSTRSIAHVRVLYNTSDRTYGGAKLQVYCENPTFTLYVKQFLSQEFTNWKYWNNVTPVAEGTPTGWAQDGRTYLQDITNPNHSFVGNVFSGKELLLSGSEPTITSKTGAIFMDSQAYFGSRPANNHGWTLALDQYNTLYGNLSYTNIMHNLYYDGANWRYRYGSGSNSGGVLTTLAYNQFSVQVANNGTTGAVATLNPAIYTNLSGNTALGKDTFVGGYKLEVEGNAFINGTLKTNKLNTNKLNTGAFVRKTLSLNYTGINLDNETTWNFRIKTALTTSPAIFFGNAQEGDEVWVYNEYNSQPIVVMVNFNSAYEGETVSPNTGLRLKCVGESNVGSPAFVYDYLYAAAGLELEP